MAKNTKKSITYKVIVGYLLLITFAAISFWFIYNNVINLNKANQLNTYNQQKLSLISEAVTNLYTAESVSRDIIQNQKPENLPLFNQQIDTISSIITTLKNTYDEKTIRQELDSLQNLLQLKEQNLLDLLEMRKSNTSQNYYDRVLYNLQKVNYLFEEDNYAELLKDYDAPTRRALVKWLEYSKQDNANRLTQQSADSLITTVKNVLSKLETEERRYQQEVIKRENELLKNDQELSSKLREVRSEIEREEIDKSVQQVKESQILIEETSTIIAFLGIACVVTIIIFVVLIIQDTNSSQRYREELEKSKSYAEFLLKRRKQIMATVTHDLRSPLNTIMGYTDLLEKTTLSDKQNHHLHQLKKSSSYILHLVNDLLDLSKLEAGKIEVEKLPFTPLHILEDSINAAIPAEKQKNIVIKTQFAESLDATFLSDPFRIQQVLVNLLSNSYKFTEEGHILIKASIEDITRKAKKLQIEIEDTGIGISKEQQKIIFNEFSQANAQIEKQYGGSGLGLTITKKIIDLLHGKISLKSKPGKGTVFFLSIPIEASSKTASKLKDIEIKNAHGKSILIIDDEPSQLTLTKEVIKQSGFKAVTANNGKTGLQLLKKNNFDLVITDIQMPQMNGFELIRKIRSIEKFKHLPVISLSGKTDLDDGTYLKKGFTTNFTKPFNANELKLEIAHILNLEIHTVEREKKSGKTHALYDLSDLHTFTDGDTQSLQLILDSFRQSSKENIIKLEKASSEKNTQQIAFVAHKILPMLKQLKVEKLAALFEKLEKQKEHHLSDKEIYNLVHKGKADLEKLIEEISKEL